MRKFAIYAALALATTALVGVPAAPAHAAVEYGYAAITGGTYVKVFDGTVNSDFTAQSMATGGPSSTVKNSTASVKVGKLLRVGAIETQSDADVTPAKTTLHSFARTANVNLLNGLIKVDAVETNITTIGDTNGGHSHTAASKLVGLEIAGAKLPINIPKNYSLTIPGIANVTLNASIHAKVDTVTATQGFAIGVTLIKPRAGFPAGVTLAINPVSHYLVEVEEASGAKLGGMAYGTRVQADLGPEIQVLSDPTAIIRTPFAGSRGDTLQNQTLGVNVPGVLRTGAVTSTSTSSKGDGGDAEITNTNKLVGLNLLGGLVKADAIEVTATGKVVDGEWTSEMSMKFVNLTIAGQKIPLNIRPNTVLNIAKLGQVAINLQRTNPDINQNRIDAIRIVLGKPQGSLPAGAVVEIGVATTVIN